MSILNSYLKQPCLTNTYSRQFMETNSVLSGIKLSASPYFFSHDRSYGTLVSCQADSFLEQRRRQDVNFREEETQLEGGKAGEEEDSEQNPYPKGGNEAEELSVSRLTQGKEQAPVKVSLKGDGTDVGGDLMHRLMSLTPSLGSLWWAHSWEGHHS